VNKGIFLLVGFIALLGCSHVEARPGHGGGNVVANPCPGIVPSGQDDGCATADKTAQFINTAFFTNARQSGQSAYSTTPTWNIAGVTYPVGQITADAGLVDFGTNIPSGWTVVSTGIYQNFGASLSLSGYYINDVGIYVPNGTLTLTNNHIRLGKNTCRSFTGLAQINVNYSGGALDAENNTWDTDSTCSWQAELYGTSYDPGLPQQFSANVTTASNVLTINSGGSGFFAEGQFLNWAGIGQQVRVSTNISPGGLKNCTGSACNGTTWTVCQLVTAANNGACNATVTDVGPVNATTGPIQPTANAAMRLAATGGTGAFTAKYNYINGYSTLAAAGTGGTTITAFNYMRMVGKTSDHDNLIAQLADPGTATTIPYYQKFNTVVWDHWAPSTGTTLFGTFLTSASANKAAGYQITYDPWDISFNTAVINSTLYPSSGVTTASAWRALQQEAAVATMANAGTSISGSVLTIATVSTGTIAVGDFVECTACSGPIQISSFGTGSGGAGTYNLNVTPTPVASSTSWRTSRYPGQVVNMIGIGNYWDLTGAGTAFIIDGQTRITSQDFTSVPNKNMVTGASCTPSSC